MSPSSCGATQVSRQAAGGLPARKYTTRVAFGLHCFTRSRKSDEIVDPALLYGDKRETRTFCPRRYDLSKRLPVIVEDLATRCCYHTGKGNFLVVEPIDKPSAAPEYEIYFATSRSARHGILNLYIQSAYVRDGSHQANRPKRKAIRLHVILHNTLNNKTIKVPPL
jgi:hypothetical protein